MLIKALYSTSTSAGDRSKMGDHHELTQQLPVGYRFMPTDEELVKYYLLNKVFDKQLPTTIIQDIEANVLYSQPPTNLVSFSCGEREWFFFIHNKLQDIDDGNFKSKRGAKSIRIVGNGMGFWKANGGQIPVNNINGDNIIAYKICFTYFSGTYPQGKKTHWVMEEIRLPGAYNISDEASKRTEEWALARVKRGKDYGNCFFH